MNLDGREITVFNAAKALLEEIETLKEDLKQLRADAEENGLSKERIGDLIAVAKDAITDQLKRERKDAQRRRRAELEGQLSLIDEKPRRAPRKAAEPKVTVGAVEGEPLPPMDSAIAIKFEGSIAEIADAIPHDPETGEVIEEGAGPQSEPDDAGAAPASEESDADEQAEGAYRGVPEPQTAAEIEGQGGPATFDLAAARRASFDDDLEIPTFARRGHPDCPVGRVPEAAE